MAEKQRILLVEDEKFLTILLKGLLEDDYDFKAVHSGEAALLAVEADPPDLILLDIMLPGISGLEVCRVITQNPRFSDIPVIILTAKTDDLDIKAGLDTGAIDYVKKPFSEIELQARIQAALRIRRYILSLKKAQEEKQALIDELNAALARVKTLSGLLPICAECKRIRNDHGSWEQLDEYISNRSNVEFTHGVCPDCAKSLYPSLYHKLMKGAP